MKTKLTHLDESGAANMVDVGSKAHSARTALASAEIRMKPSTLKAIAEGAVAKGDVLAAARLAGIMAAKKTPELIPLCHQLNLSKVAVELKTDLAEGLIRIEALAKTTGPTGVEMEALTAASVAALTIYDMAKALDRAMVIGDIKVLRKEGGASGLYERPAD